MRPSPVSHFGSLYQEQILEHSKAPRSKAPRNYRELEVADRKAQGYSPLCGDRSRVYLQIQGDCIQDVSFQGSGCALPKASASMMTQGLQGKTRSEAKQLLEHFHRTVRGQSRENAAENGKTRQALIVFISLPKVITSHCLPAPCPYFGTPSQSLSFGFCRAPGKSAQSRVALFPAVVCRSHWRGLWEDSRRTCVLC